MPLSSLSRAALAFALLCALASHAAEQKADEGKPPAPRPPGANDKEKKSEAPAPPAIEGAKPAADGIYILIDQLNDALRLVPRAYILKPEEYRKLVDEIERLKAQIRPNRLIPPSSVLLKGKIEGNVAQLQAVFDFATDQPNALVHLACSQASILAANLDGNTILWRNDVETFTVQVEKTGNHKVVLDLSVRLTTRGGGLALEIDLPRATSTHLELDLPPGSRDVRVGNQAIEPPNTLKDNRLDAKLGLTGRLEVTWKDAKAAGGTTPLLSAESRTAVRIDERLVTTTVDITLGSQGGPAKEYRVQVPAGCEVRLASADQARVLAIDATDAPGGSLRVVRLKEASLDPLRATLLVRSAPPRPGNPLPLGPFNLLGAARQAGTVLIANAAADLRPQLQARGDLARRDITEEEQRSDPTLIAAYNFRTVAAADKPIQPPGPAQPWLELDVENVRGLIETRVSHTLKLQRDAAGLLTWRVVTTLDATPIRTGVDRLEILLPPDCRYDKQRGPRPADLVKHAEFDEATRVLSLKLNAEPLKAFQLIIECAYREPTGESGRAVIPLPMPRDTRDRGGLITVAAPDDCEITIPETGNFTLELIGQDPQKIQWRSDRLPAKVDLGWHPHKPEIRVVGVVDLTLAPQSGMVRHQLRLLFGRTPPTQLALRLPEGLADRLAIVEGGRWLDGKPGSDRARWVELLTPAAKEHLITLEYTFPLPSRAAGQPLAIPLVIPEGAAAGETKVRVWCEPGSLPLPPGGSWSELNLEEVKGKERLPVLVLRSQRLDVPLALPMGEAAPAAPVVLVDRTLVRVGLQDGGGQAYHASFLLRQVAASQLDVELPAPIPGLGLRIDLDAKQMDWEVPEDGAGRVARLRLGTELVRQPVALDVMYHLPQGRTGYSLVRGTLQPPVLRGTSDQSLVRWQITLPSGWVPLAPEGGPGGDRSWSFHRRLLTPRLTITNADLERWFAGQELSRRPIEATGVPSHVCWRNGLEPIVLTHVPQMAWLLFCSLGVLLVGRTLARLSQPVNEQSVRPSIWFLPAFAFLGLAFAIVWLLYPTLLTAIIFGGQIGAVVLLLWLGTEWVVRERYRRQVVFLPSFTRPRKGSSLIRPTGSSARHRGEPSTVDAPPPERSLAAGEELS